MNSQNIKNKKITWRARTKEKIRKADLKKKRKKCFLEKRITGLLKKKSPLPVFAKVLTIAKGAKKENNLKKKHGLENVMLLKIKKKKKMINRCDDSRMNGRTSSWTGKQDGIGKRQGTRPGGKWRG